MSSSVNDGTLPDDAYDVYSVSFWAKVLINCGLVAVITFLLMKIYKKRNEPQDEEPEDPVLPKMKKRDFTIQELREFDGTNDEGRILVAVNGKVFDVTKGKHFYGPGGVYSTFGGHDASRGLATFSVSGKDEYDDLSDLNSLELESMLEWETQFMEKYDYVGRLLKPGELHSYYTDEEETPTNKLHLENPKQCESEKPKTEENEKEILDYNYEKQDETPNNKLQQENPKQCESEKSKTETEENEKEILDFNHAKQDDIKSSSNGSAKQDDDLSLEK